MARIIVKERRARPFWFGHPWVFSGAIERIKGSPKDGEVVEVCDHQGQVIGQGFWNGRSQIRVRLAALASEGPLGLELLLARLEKALDLRQHILNLSAVTSAYRLVHAEGDGLPGLVVDRVGPFLLFQVSSLGLVPYLEPILDRLQERLAPEGVLEKVSRVAVEEEGLEREPGLLRGKAPEGPVEIEENGTFYLVDVVGGQKTGWYADQRQNRRRVAAWARGREVLDAFSYVGGFGLLMAREGAASVTLLDSSEGALELARLAAERNQVGSRVAGERQNVLRALERYHREGRLFDVVVVDPPKLVPRRAALKRGLRLYHEINLKAVQVLRPHGLLVSCSCSQHVLESDFEELLGSVAKETGVRFQELYRGGQGPDHPVLLPLEESRYLKCRALRVL